jgi:NADPH-dependent curcumin reductase CurA
VAVNIRDKAWMASSRAMRPAAASLASASAAPKRLDLKGYIVLDHYDLLSQFTAEMTGWIADGRIKWRDTVIDGLENAPGAFLGLFSGDNVGKMLVKLTDG